jgi:spermidine/putrescine transport system substrate-binding protein
MKDPNSLPKDPILAQLVRMSRTRVTRRTALAGAVGVGAAFGLAGCASDSSESENVVVWNNWQGYIDLTEDELSSPTLDRFKEQTGITVEYLEDYSDNVDWYSLNSKELAAGTDVGADLICPTDWLAARLVTDGQVQRFDEVNIPNKANLAAGVIRAPHDPDRNFTLPYQGVLAGIAYNKELYKELTGQDSPRTVQDLWSAQLNGRVVVLSEMRDTVGLIASAKDLDIASETSFNEDAFNGVIEDIAALYADGKIQAFAGNEYMDGFENDQYVAGLVWSGDMIQLNFSAGYEKFGFFLPESGGTISYDVFTIPNGATHKKNAEALINYYYDPVNAAELAAYVNYITPVAGAYEEAIKLDPALAENKQIFPDDEFLGRTRAFRTLNSQEEKSFEAAWSKVQLGV